MKVAGCVLILGTKQTCSVHYPHLQVLPVRRFSETCLEIHL